MVLLAFPFDDTVVVNVAATAAVAAAFRCC